MNKKLKLFTQAVTHSSYANLRKTDGNERLEFLGDAILGAIVAEALYEKHPHLPEGELTKMRAQCVQGKNLAHVAAQLGLEGELRHELKNISPSAREHLLEQAFEALVGAMFVEWGWEKTKREVLKILPMEGAQENFNPKGLLQEKLQPKIGVEDIDYRTVKEAGPKHERQFTVELWVQGKKLSTGTAASKKAAQEAAANEALKRLTADGK